MGLACESEYCEKMVVKNEEIKASVVIPAYNVEKYIVDCLNSVIHQTLEHIEIVCVDDASTDSTTNILHEFSQKDDRIKVIELNQNQGQSVARNIGLNIAKGRYIYFLDADDLISERCLETLYDISCQNKLDICYFNASVIFENEELEMQYQSYRTIHKTICKDALKGGELFEEFMRNNDWSPSPPRQFFRKQFLLDAGLKFEPGIIHEDMLFSFLAIIRAERVMCIPEQLFYRRFRQNSTMTSCKSSRNIKGLFICYCKVLDELKERQHSEKVKGVITKYLDLLLVNVKSVRKKVGNITSNLFGDSYQQYLFNNVVERKEEYYKVSEQSVQKLQRASKVYIFGAGAIAEMITLQLSTQEIPIEAYVVTNLCENPKVFLGHPVIAINQLEETSTILIATAERYHNEITMELSKRGNFQIEYVQYDE